MTSAALAFDVGGEVEVNWDNEDKFGGELGASFSVDLTKDFGDGVSAGLAFKGVVADDEDKVFAERESDEFDSIEDLYEEFDLVYGVDGHDDLIAKIEEEDDVYIVLEINEDDPEA